MEKKSIIDELINQAQAYLDERVDMKIAALQDYDIIPDKCSRCYHELVEICARSAEPTSHYELHLA